MMGLKRWKFSNGEAGWLNALQCVERKQAREHNSLHVRHIRADASIGVQWRDVFDDGGALIVPQGKYPLVVSATG